MKEKKTNQENRTVEKHPSCSLQDFCRGNPDCSGFIELSFLTGSFKRGTTLILKSHIHIIINSSCHFLLNRFYKAVFLKTESNLSTSMMNHESTQVRKQNQSTTYRLPQDILLQPDSRNLEIHLFETHSTEFTYYVFIYR